MGDTQKPRDFDKVGFGALAVLVMGLGIVVWLALPKDEVATGFEGGSTAVRDAGIAGRPATTLERLAEATVELAVLSDKPEADVAKLASAEELVKRLDVRHCGGACDAVKKRMLDHDHFEIEVLKSEDYILPPKESYGAMAPGLTTVERASIEQRATTIVVRSRGTADVDQLPARAAFAATSVIADALSGLVYDEVARRIEAPRELAQHAITAALGQNVFAPGHVVIQLYRQEDGSARLLTLGMARFGSPDFTMRGAPMELGPSLANVMNVVASHAAAARTDLAPVTLAEVARVAGRSPEELAKDPRTSSAMALETVDAERTEGDPENEMLELIPRGGSTREAWIQAATELFGEMPRVVFAGKDPELDAIAARARRELPAAAKRLENGEGALFVKGPFAIPPESRFDGGASEEWMWIQATACTPKSCAGLLTNTPGYAINLAPGRPVTVDREKTADWLLRLGDGGTVGGESIAALRKRR